MLSALLITLREGLEAALIVSIIAAYLVRSNQRGQLRHVWTGVAVAVAASLTVGIAVAAGGAALSDRAQEIFEGVAGLIAVAVLTWMIFFMRRHARAQRSELETAAAGALDRGHPGALRLLAFSAVGREGLETVLFLNASFRTSDTPGASGTGAVAGLVIAIALAYGMYRGGVRLNLRRFFQITGALLIVVAAGLVSTSFHEFDEAGVLTVLNATAWDISGFIAPAGVVGSVLRGMFGYDANPTILQVIVYWAYLVPTMIAFFGVPRFARRTRDVEPEVATYGEATAG